MKVTKLRKESKDKVIEDVESSLDEIESIFVVARNKDNTFSWWTSDNNSLLWIIGALEWLKNALMSDKGFKL
jgi:hypothetical protein